MTRPLIQCLLGLGRPSDVARLITAIVVDPIEGVGVTTRRAACVGSRAQLAFDVLDERPKSGVTAPLIAHADATVEVVGAAVGIRSAATTHRPPQWSEWVIGQTMRPAIASARANEITAQVGGEHEPRAAAVALTAPQPAAPWHFLDARHGCQLAEALTSEIELAAHIKTLPVNGQPFGGGGA